MKTATNEVAIWERIIRQDRPMTQKVARELLTLEFSTEDVSRMHELSERNSRGRLAANEEEELDDFCRVGTMLAILKSRARQSLKS